MLFNQLDSDKCGYTPHPKLDEKSVALLGSVLGCKTLFLYGVHNTRNTGTAVTSPTLLSNGKQSKWM
jgi:hypothetical protein